MGERLPYRESEPLNMNATASRPCTAAQVGVFSQLDGWLKDNRGEGGVERFRIHLPLRQWTLSAAFQTRVAGKEFLDQRYQSRASLRSLNTKHNLLASKGGMHSVF